VLLASAGCLALAQLWVLRSGYGAFTSLPDVPSRPVGIVFGAGVYPGGTLSPVLERRVRAGVELYRSGRVRKLLMSGDNGRPDYDEVTAMKRRAVQLGVPARDVVRDFAGFRSYDTCYRAREIFDVRSAVLVTQAFHMPRALYLARGVGIDAVGYVAEPGMPEDVVKYLEGREVGARFAAVRDVVLRPRPRFLGPPEPLFENEHPDR
jgi:vancomycin permeability regulator SanA